jgi:hypothetical protein
VPANSSTPVSCGAGYSGTAYSNQTWSCSAGTGYSWTASTALDSSGCSLIPACPAAVPANSSTPVSCAAGYSGTAYSDQTWSCSAGTGYSWTASTALDSSGCIILTPRGPTFSGVVDVSGVCKTGAGGACEINYRGEVRKEVLRQSGGSIIARDNADLALLIADLYSLCKLGVPDPLWMGVTAHYSSRGNVNGYCYTDPAPEPLNVGRRTVMGYITMWHIEISGIPK